MKRVATIILGVWLVITLGLALLAGLTQARRSVSADGLSRAVEPRVLFGRGQSGVRLDYVPDAACPPAALSIFLLLDKSESMADGDAFPIARAAAAAFTDGVDLTHSSVAVAYFDDEPDFVQPATQDAAALAAALGAITSPGGSTNVTGALQLAAANPGTGRPVVILLTDGVADDPVGAMAAGQALKAAGAHLITIAVGPAADVDFLRDLASGPAAAFAPHDPAELTAIYTDLADQLSSVVAANLTLTETIDESFAVDPDSITPAAVLNGQRVVWQTGFLPAEGASYTYDVAAQQYGWRAIPAEAATMSFIDCQAGLASLSLGAGPRLLVLPGLGFWLPWLLGLLLPVFLLFRGRKPAPPPIPTVASAAPAPTPAPNPYPAWLRKLNSADILGLADDSGESGNLTPTIIVGLGPVGRIVLSQVAQALDGRFIRRDKLPVRLLQVDVRPLTGPAPERPDYLLDDEWVLLRPEFRAMSSELRTNPQDWPHMRWYEPTAPADYGRAHGRLALFYDLRHGADNSTLIRGLRRAARDMDRPRLRVVGSTFDDVSGGMLVDICWLMWLTTQRNVDVELWLTGPVNRDWSPRLDNPARAVSQFEQRARTLATLREIERFQRNAVVPLHYVPRAMNQAEFHQEVDSAVVQTLFLFETPPKSTSVEDHLATLTDGLVSLLNPTVQRKVTEHLDQFKERAGNLVNDKGHGLVCGMGAYAIATPQAPLREALAWRLVHDLLCEARTGLLPARRLLLNGDYEEQNPDAALGPAADRRSDVNKFIEDHRRRLNSDDFLQTVGVRVATELNGGEEGTPATARAGGIRRARKWVEQLRTLLIQEGEPEAAAPLASLLRELEAWDVFLSRELCPAAADQLRRARERLKALTTQGGRSWSVGGELEWPAYRAAIRSWLDQPSRAESGEAIIRAANRFGWQAIYDLTARNWQLELWIPEGGYIWAGAPPPRDKLVAPRDPAAVLARLYDLALPLAHNATQEVDAMRRATGMNKNEWREAAEPRLAFHDPVVTKLLPGATSVMTLLAARETDSTAQIRKELGATGEADTIVACAIEDRTSVTLLRVRDRVPLGAAHLYGGEADGNDPWRENAVTPGHYVWFGEQAAAAREGGRRFGSRFVGFLERDDRLVDLYARACLFGLVEESRGRMSIVGAEGWTWPGAAAGEGLINLFDAGQRPAVLNQPENRRREALAAVERAINEAEVDGLVRAAFRREMERCLLDQPRGRAPVEPWLDAMGENLRLLVVSDQQEDQDLRYYLLHLLSAY